MNKFSVRVILLLCLTVSVVKCRRITGGGNRRISSRPHPSPPRHDYHPTHSSSGTVRPIGFGDHPHQSATSRPVGFDPPSRPSAPIPPPKHNSPLESGTHGTGTGTVRPIGFDVPGSGHHSSGSNNPQSGSGRPIGFDIPGHSSGSVQTGHAVGPPRQSTQTGHSPPLNNPAGYGPPPAYNQGGYGNPYHSPGNPWQNNPQGGYHPQAGYPYGGAGGHTVINNNVNNHYHGGYGGGYGGYSPPVYTSHDTGSTALGFFLGYSLAKVTTPSFAYHNGYDSGPRYDHYTVHHYYHNKDAVPAEATIQPNAVVACVGDSGSFCPANTTSLCTNNGAVMCVASATSTVPCSDARQTNCVKSTVPCKDNNAPECKGSGQDTASIAIPCISTAKIYGHVTFVNNSVVVSNYTVNSTSPSGSATSNSNVTASDNVTTEAGATTEASANVTTTEGSTNVTTVAATNATDSAKEEPQMFCVTILALPAERKLTQGEKFFHFSQNVFSKFVIKSLGIE